MNQSKLFFKSQKEVPQDADSINASYLVRAGFVHKQMAGVYALLPLGLRVVRKIEKIVREEMDKIGGQEILMNVLQPRELWEETGRWESAIDIFYKLVDSRDKEMLLAPTHEEQVVDIVRKKIKSYKDLPFSLYQIQTKFRNEPRAKSGLLRGREFIMKDMYSFHEDEASFNKFYEQAKVAYEKIYKRLGLSAKLVAASGGIFSKYSHEYQVLSEIGEDTIYSCAKCDFAQNKEIAEVKAGDKCPDCGAAIEENRGIEVGNIFPLKVKYSEPMNATFSNREGKEEAFIMGCYGLGITRSMATVVEVSYDTAKNKMVWPKEISPFDVHVISLGKNAEAQKVVADLEKAGYEVLFDDREATAGVKFAEADLIGIPLRIVVSEKTLQECKVEFTQQDQPAKLIAPDTIISKLNKVY